MMAKHISLMAWSAVVVLGLAVQTHGVEGFAFVDMDRVFSEFYKTKRADARLKEQAAQLKEERDVGVEKLRGLEGEFNTARQEAQDQTLSEEARDRKRGEAEDKLIELRETENELRAMEESRRKKIEEQGQRMRKRIVDEIGDVVEQIAVENDYFSVIDASGASLNNVPVFIYHKSDADITDQVIRLLNQNESMDPDDDESLLSTVEEPAEDAEAE